MPQQTQVVKPSKLNFDVSKKYLKEDEVSYSLNYDTYSPSHLGKGVPFGSNLPLCEMDMPEGENFNNGSAYFAITSETYYWTYNSNGINFISRINADGICDIIYTNTDTNNCLQLSAAPENKITNFRCVLVIEKSDCANRHGKYLHWTDGIHDLGWIDVEASIATNNFTTDYFADCVDGCEPIQLCVPQPCQIITAEYIPTPEDQISLNNDLADTGFKFIFRHLYYDNLRKSEWSDVSTLYYQDAASCFYSSKGESRCIRLRVPAGNPLVVAVEIAFTKGDKDDNLNQVWRRAATIEKYKKYNSSEQYWYERDISNELTNYSDCAFDYIFCNNEQCVPVDISEVTRVYNPTPQKVQAIIPIANAYGYVNYEQGNCQLDRSEVDKFKISIDCTTKVCEEKLRTLKVRAIVHQTTTNVNQFIWRHLGALNDKDDVTDPAWFGGNEGSALDDQHEQKFGGTVRNFIAYVEGTEYFAEMKQFQGDAGFVSGTEVGVLAGGSLGAAFTNSIADVKSDGGYFYMEATLLIPFGMRGFIRLSSHLGTGFDPNTSTKIEGVINDIRNYVTDSALVGYAPFVFEIPFGCADTELVKSFIITDATLLDGSGNHSAVETVGYIKDDIGNPLEGLEIHATIEDLVGPDDTNKKLAQTDHNGYYHFYNWVGHVKNSTSGIYGELECTTWTKIQAITLNRTAYSATQTVNATISDSNYLDNFYALVNVPVKDCNGAPVAGVKIALSGSKSQITKSNGIAQFKIRNYSTRNRTVTAIMMNKYGCDNIDCNDVCNPCAEGAVAGTAACYSGKPNYTLSNLILNLSSALDNKTGLKKGGLYPFGFVVEGDCGFISAVNELPQIQINKAQGDSSLGYCSFSYDATGMVLPDEAKCLKIVRGANLNNYELQWLIDKIEKTIDGKLKLTIQSLNTYNENHFFKTNTNYQYLSGDRIEFISNGDGKLFDVETYGQLNYQILSPFLDTSVVNPDITLGADYFNQLLIENDGRLDKLTEGAKIEIQRPKECTTDPVYFGIGANIPVVNGRLVSETGTFQTFDTYEVSRQVGKFSLQTFENKTPSDFWGGTNIDDTGRSYFVNKFENKKRYGRNISVSTPNQLNYFGTIVKTFDSPEHGDIVGISIYDSKIGLAIGEKDNFLFQVSDDLVRVGNDGTIRAAAPDQLVSNGEPKVRGRYGCKYEDIGSIFFGDGFVTWIDEDRIAHVKHDFNLAKDISIGKMQTYFRRKIREKNVINVAATNDLDKVRWITGENKVNSNVMLTIKSLRNPSINNDYIPFETFNATIVFNADSEDYLTTASFTPEGFDIMELNDNLGAAFIVFDKGIPYLHPVNPVTYNTFFGIACDQVFTPSFNKFPEKLKNFIACELQSDTRFFAKKIQTDSATYDSEVPAVKVASIGDKKWNMPFLANKNSAEGLYGNRTASGYWCSVTFMRDNTNNLIYNSILEEKRQQFSQIDLLLVKMSFNEQSGLDQNL